MRSWVTTDMHVPCFGFKFLIRSIIHVKGGLDLHHIIMFPQCMPAEMKRVSAPRDKLLNFKPKSM